jgi:hypothetical protein
MHLTEATTQSPSTTTLAPFGVRIARRGNDGYQNPRIGVALPLSQTDGVICNTGYPFKLVGSVKPLHVAIARLFFHSPNVNFLAPPKSLAQGCPTKFPLSYRRRHFSPQFTTNALMPGPDIWSPLL